MSAERRRRIEGLMRRALARREPDDKRRRERDAITREVHDELKRRARRLRDEMALLKLAYRALTNLPAESGWHMVRAGQCDACGDGISERVLGVTCPRRHRLHVPRCLSFETAGGASAEAGPGGPAWPAGL